MLLDVAYTLNQFSSPLPASYLDFKLLTHTVFPRLLDTKLMASTPPFNAELLHTSLEELHTVLMMPPYHLPACPPKSGSAGYSSAERKYHMAGYDAYVTGLVFLGLSRRLWALKGQRSSLRFLPDSSLMQPFINKLYIKVRGVTYMSLVPEARTPGRIRPG